MTPSLIREVRLRMVGTHGALKVLVGEMLNFAKPGWPVHLDIPSQKARRMPPTMETTALPAEKYRTG